MPGDDLSSPNCFGLAWLSAGEGHRKVEISLFKVTRAQSRVGYKEKREAVVDWRLGSFRLSEPRSARSIAVSLCVVWGYKIDGAAGVNNKLSVAPFGAVGVEASLFWNKRLPDSYMLMI